MQESASLQGSLLKYVQVFMVQTAHTAIANARAKIMRSLLRWILMARDRLDDKTLPLTHEFLSLMLGVSRAAVTGALQALKAQKLIQSARGAIVVLNRGRRLRRPPSGVPGGSEYVTSVIQYPARDPPRNVDDLPDPELGR